MGRDELIAEMARSLESDLLTFSLMAANIRDRKLQAELVEEGKRRRNLVDAYYEVSAAIAQAERSA